jgi:hypothetical protein
MEIVLATNGLAGIGGSETYLLTVAEQLQRLGHAVTVHAATGGAMSDFMAGRGLPVTIGERGLPDACEAILVQDAAMAYALAERWPETPQVFRCPSALHHFQFLPSSPASSPRSSCAATGWRATWRRWRASARSCDCAIPSTPSGSARAARSASAPAARSCSATTSPAGAAS